MTSYALTCEELEQRVLAIFTSAPEVDAIIKSIADQYSIPHFSVSPPAATHDNPFTIELGASKGDMTEVVRQTVVGLRMESVGLVSHASTGLLYTARLVEGLQRAGVEVFVLDLDQNDVRPDLAQLRNISLIDL